MSRPMSYVIYGDAVVGFIRSRGPKGFEAFDREEASLGIFPRPGRRAPFSIARQMNGGRMIALRPYKSMSSTAFEQASFARAASPTPSGGRRMTRHDYLLQELRCASLRARLWQPDIDAVGAALKAGWITSEQAVETLNDCDCLQLIAPKETHDDGQQR